MVLPVGFSKSSACPPSRPAQPRVRSRRCRTSATRSGSPLIGVVFFDEVHAGYDHAFVRSTCVLAVLGLVLAALTRLLAARERR